MTSRHFYEDQEAPTKWEQEIQETKGKGENMKQIATDERLILTTIMTLRSTTNSCGPQLNSAASAAHDRHILRKPHPSHITPLLPPFGRVARITSILEGVLDVTYQHLIWARVFQRPLHISRHTV